MKKRRVLAMIGLVAVMSLGITSIYLLAKSENFFSSKNQKVDKIPESIVKPIRVNSESKIITLKNPKNQNLAFINVQNSAQNSSSVLADILLYLSSIDTSSIQNENNKKVLEKLTNNLQNLREKIRYNMKNSALNINSKIKDLEFEDADYKDRLFEIQSELSEINNELEKIFFNLTLQLNPLEDPKKLKEDFKNLSSFKKAYTMLKGNQNSLPNFWNLINAFKFKNIKISTFFNLKSAVEEKNKIKSMVKILTQILALHIKRQIQTIAIALLIEENISEEKLLLSFNKLSFLHFKKIQQAKLSNQFISEIMNLENDLNLIEKQIFTIFKDYSKFTWDLFPNVFLAIQNLFNQLQSYKKWYFGFNKTDWNIRKSVRPGLKQIVKKLQSQLNDLTAQSITSIKDFNNLYQNSLFSLKQSEGFLYGWRYFSDVDLETTKKSLTSLLNTIQNKENQNIQKTLENSKLLQKVLELKKLLDNFETKIIKINAGSLVNAKKNSNQIEYDSKIVSLSYFVENYLLQAATDNLDFYTQLYSIEDLKILF